MQTAPSLIPATAMPIEIDARRHARSLYWRGWGVTQIASELDVPRTTVQAWKDRGKWDEAPSISKIEDALECRLNLLIAKDRKDGGDCKEIDLLMRQVVSAARVRRFEGAGGHEGDLNANVANRNKGEKKKAAVNHLTEEQIEALCADFHAGLFGYQRTWWAAREEDTRFILKSRQIGATWYFAREAFVDALETGRNQIFLSASRNQANIFRSYIIDWVFRITGVQLKGENLLIDRGPGEEQPTLYFLGTNYRTAQGYHGNFYFDECFWVHAFEQIDEVASGMASQKRYRETYFSTPSTKTHDAYGKWSGEAFNADRPKVEQVKIDTSHQALRDGARGGDGIWRQIVTLLDAEASGCDLFDVEKLRRKKTPESFALLYLCQFLDDTASMFPFALVSRCHVDAFDKWRDFTAQLPRPFGDSEVWIGYDPQESANGDDAACVVVAPPAKIGGQFRVLEKFRWKGLDYQAQAAKLKALTTRYRVTHIAIDTTGLGSAVWQLVVAWFPRAARIDYSVAVKTEMVLKAKNVMSHGRLAYDASWADVSASFMAIAPQLTQSQRQVTYVAKRGEKIGHADLAWAIMHALHNEPLDADTPKRKSKMKVLKR